MDGNFQEENRTNIVNISEEDNTEKKLVLAAQDGDQKAFGQLVKLHQKKLFRFIYGLVKSFDMTEDIVQEAFVKAYQNLESFNPEYSFYPWLSTIARNLAYNQIQRDEKKESLDKLTESGFNPTDTNLGPLEQLLDTENKKRFYKALSTLPAKYRTVFVLRHFEQMDYARIASYLKIPPGTVDSRLYRARQLLTEKLKDLL